MISGFLCMIALWCWFAQRFQPDFDALKNATPRTEVNSTVIFTADPIVWSNTSTMQRVIDFFQAVVLPFIILWGIITAIIGIYSLMVSDKDDDLKKWVDYIIYWSIGIVIATSAWFITRTLQSTIEWALPSNFASAPTNFALFAQNLYTSLVLPFIKLWSYLVLATLFVIVFVHVVRFLTSADDKIVANARQIIISSTVGIIIVMLSSRLVQALFGTLNTMANSTSTALNPLLNSTDALSPIFIIVNYFLWFIAFFILIVFIYQWFILLFRPTEEKQLETIKKTTIYALVWLALIWSAYLIINFILPRF